MPYQTNIKETQTLKGNIIIGERGEQGPAGPAGPRGEPGGAYIQQQTLNITNESNTAELLSNVYYVINSTNTHGVVSITLRGSETGLCDEFLGQVTTSSSLILSFPTGTKWLTNEVDVSNNSIILLSGKTYTFSVINGLGVVIVYE